MPNYSFQSSGMRRKQNFEIFFEKVSLSFRLLPFAFSPPRFFCFSFPPPFFSFVGHLLGYLSVGKDFAKRSKIVNFFWRKYQCVVGQDFDWNFLLKVTRFFASFFGLFDWIALIWVWLERSHLPAQGSCQSCPGPFKLMTSQVVQGTWLKKGGYGRFRGQCVNTTKGKILEPFSCQQLYIIRCDL